MAEGSQGFNMKPIRTATFIFLSVVPMGAQPSAGHPVAAIPMVHSWQTFTDPNEGAFQLEGRGRPDEGERAAVSGMDDCGITGWIDNS